MARIAIIGGTGIKAGDILNEYDEVTVETPYGPPSAPIANGIWHDHEILFLARHGAKQEVPPHRINYRANIHALQSLSTDAVFAFAAVGGISRAAAPEAIVIPDQIIDYTHSRITSFYDDGAGTVKYIDFTEPYSPDLRAVLIKAARQCQINVIDHGVYGATQGPRLETAAEIKRMSQDGCDIVGMTGMPEAALAREASLDYAAVAIVANRAAGLGGREITLEQMIAALEAGHARARRLIEIAVQLFCG